MRRWLRDSPGPIWILAAVVDVIPLALALSIVMYVVVATAQPPTITSGGTSGAPAIPGVVAPPLDPADALRIENAQLRVMLAEETAARLRTERERLIDDAAARAGVDSKAFRPDVGRREWRKVTP